MQELRNNIRVQTFVPLTVSNETVEGDAVDTYEVNDVASPAFTTAFITAVVGAVGADVLTATVKIEESDSSTFASGVSTARGGDAVNVFAGDMTVNFQVQRTKRYLRAVVTITEDGAADTVQFAVTGILSNWALPIPTV
jgi:hypothetical protein